MPRRLRTEIILQFPIDIQQRRRRLDADLHGEREPMCLSVAVIRILSEDDDLRICKTCVVQCVEDRKHIRIDALCAVLCDEELAQFPIVRLRHLICKEFLPVIFKNFLCHIKLSRKFQKYSFLRRVSLCK